MYGICHYILCVKDMKWRAEEKIFGFCWDIFNGNLYWWKYITKVTNDQRHENDYNTSFYGGGNKCIVI